MFDNDRVSGGVAAWFSTTLGALAAVFLLCLLASAIFPRLGAGVVGVVMLFQVGLWQWLYSIPLIVLMRRRKCFESAKGVTIAACVAFGANALCSGLLFFGSR
jgi:hypothetical protein